MKSLLLYFRFICFFLLAYSHPSFISYGCNLYSQLPFSASSLDRPYLAIKKCFKGISEFEISFSPGNDQTQTYFYGIIPLKSAKEGTKDEVAAL